MSLQKSSHSYQNSLFWALTLAAVVYHYTVVPVIYLVITLIAFSVFLGLVRLQSSRYISASLMNMSPLTCAVVTERQ